MFIGHHAMAFASKKAAPKVKLGTLLFAAQFLDLLFPLLVLANVEHLRVIPNDIPFLRLDLYNMSMSHSLLMSLIWSFIIGGAYFLLKKEARSAIVVACAVFSHWLVDFISHTPDLQIIPGWNYRVGLGLWNSMSATIVVETALFVFGVYLYLNCTKAKSRFGKFAPWTLIIFLSISYIANIVSPPNLAASTSSDASTVAWIVLSQWLFVPWGYWIDRHRE